MFVLNEMLCILIQISWKSGSEVLIGSKSTVAQVMSVWKHIITLTNIDSLPIKS